MIKLVKRPTEMAVMSKGKLYDPNTNAENGNEKMTLPSPLTQSSPALWSSARHVKKNKYEKKKNPRTLPDFRAERVD